MSKHCILDNNDYKKIIERAFTFNNLERIILFIEDEYRLNFKSNNLFRFNVAETLRQLYNIDYETNKYQSNTFTLASDVEKASYLHQYLIEKEELISLDKQKLIDIKFSLNDFSELFIRVLALLNSSEIRKKFHSYELSVYKQKLFLLLDNFKRIISIDEVIKIKTKNITDLCKLYFTSKTQIYENQKPLLIDETATKLHVAYYELSFTDIEIENKLKILFSKLVDDGMNIYTRLNFSKYRDYELKKWRIIKKKLLLNTDEHYLVNKYIDFLNSTNKTKINDTLKQDIRGDLDVNKVLYNILKEIDEEFDLFPKPKTTSINHFINYLIQKDNTKDKIIFNCKTNIVAYLFDKIKKDFPNFKIKLLPRIIDEDKLFYMNNETNSYLNSNTIKKALLRKINKTDSNFIDKKFSKYVK